MQAGMPITEEFLDALANRLVSRILARIGEFAPPDRAIEGGVAAMMEEDVHYCKD